MSVLNYRCWGIKEKKYLKLHSIHLSTKRVIVTYGNGNVSKLFSEVILEQDTGLKDKNGKAIFEGDIIEQNEWPECRAVCYRDDSDASFDFRVIGGNDNPKSFIEEYEVVGNIHEEEVK